VPSPSSFRGRVAVITGGAGGIGAALGRALLDQGARVALLDCNASQLAVASRALGSSLVCTHEVDVRDPEACDYAIHAVVKRWGGVDVLVNNAGISHRSKFEETSLDVIRRMMEVNFFGAVHCTHAALPSLLERRGSIAVMSSVAGFAPLVGRTGYCASKHALHGFFEALRTEVEPKGVHVMISCPSFTATELERTALSGAGTSLGDSVRAVTGRVLRPEEVADAVVAGLAKRRRLLVPSAVSRSSFWLSRLAPRVYEKLMLRSQRAEFPIAG